MFIFEGVMIRLSAQSGSDRFLIITEMKTIAQYGEGQFSGPFPPDETETELPAANRYHKHASISAAMAIGTMHKGRTAAAQ